MTPVKYICPVCEPGPYHFAGTIVAIVCSRCTRGMRGAKTGADRPVRAPVTLTSIFDEYDDTMRRAR